MSRRRTVTGRRWIPFSGVGSSMYVDLCLPLSEIAPQLARLVRKEIPADEEGAYDVPDEMGNEMPKLDPRMPDNVAKLGHPSDFTCLECDGPL